MGHTVMEVPIDATSNQLNRALYPTVQQLKGVDGILLSGPEHIRTHLQALYPEWNQLPVRKVSWLHETVDREDYKKLPIREVLGLADLTFSPAIQDEKYGMRWLPFGVDTEVFKPDWNQSKAYDVAFIGLVYPKRAQFLSQLAPHLKGIQFSTGNVQVLDLRGLCIRETAALYAENLRKIKVFLNLPSLTEVAVTKIYEVQACGTFLITPSIPERRNLNGIDAHFYDPRKPEQLAESIRFCLEHESERAVATRQCCEQMFQKHRLENRCELLIDAFRQA